MKSQIFSPAASRRPDAMTSALPRILLPLSPLLPVHIGTPYITNVNEIGAARFCEFLKSFPPNSIRRLKSGDLGVS